MQMPKSPILDYYMTDLGYGYSAMATNQHPNMHALAKMSGVRFYQRYASSLHVHLVESIVNGQLSLRATKI